jgi:3-oxoadipate enol-lactonase
VSPPIAVRHRFDGPEDAPVVVLAHSVGCDLSMWDPQVDALSARFRVLRYDHRGHGGSPVPDGPYSMADLGGDVLALLDRLELERVHVGGLSLGGMVAMWLATHAPQRVDRLVLCCTAAHFPPPELWDERARAVRAEGMGALVDGVMERWLTPGFRAREPEAVERLRATFLATAPEGYAGCCAAIRDMDLRAELPGVAAPTLVLAGAEDPATPPARGAEIADAIPGARLEVLPDAAHLANLEQRDALTRAMAEHLGASDPKEGP